MFNTSTKQALSIWTELMEAYYGDNPYGGNVAEIYVFRLLPFFRKDNPMMDEEEHYQEANESLYCILQEFADQLNCEIEVDEKELGDWLKDSTNGHRWHVKVISD